MFLFLDIFAHIYTHGARTQIVAFLHIAKIVISKVCSYNGANAFNKLK